MPFVDIKMAASDGSLSTQQKSELISEISTTIERVLGKDVSRCMVCIEEFPPENLGIGKRTLKSILEEKEQEHTSSGSRL